MLALSAALIANLVIAFQVGYFGSNNSFGAMLAATTNLAMAAILAVLRSDEARCDAKGWRLPAFLWLAAIIWAVLPDLVERFFGHDLLVQMGGERVTPDMLGVNLWRTVGTIAAIYAGVTLGLMRRTIRPFINLFLLFSLLCNVAFMVWGQIQPGYFMGRPLGEFLGRYAGTVLNPNSAATLLGVTAVLAAACALATFLRVKSQRSRFARVQWIVYAAIALAALMVAITTGARTAVGLTLAFILLLAWRHGQKRVMMSVMLAIGLFMLLFWTAGIMNLFGSTSTERFYHLADDLQPRTEMWAYYVEVATRNLWAGYGLFSFSSVNLASLRDVQSIRSLWAVNSAHNILIEMMMEGGLPYLLLSSGAVIAALRRTWPAIQGGGDRTLAEAVLMSLVLIFGVSLVDIALTVPAIQTVSSLFAGLLWGRALRR